MFLFLFWSMNIWICFLHLCLDQRSQQKYSFVCTEDLEELTTILNHNITFYGSAKFEKKPNLALGDSCIFFFMRWTKRGYNNCTTAFHHTHISYWGDDENAKCRPPAKWKEELGTNGKSSSTNWEMLGQMNCDMLSELWLWHLLKSKTIEPTEKGVRRSRFSSSSSSVWLFSAV